MDELSYIKDRLNVLHGFIVEKQEPGSLNIQAFIDVPALHTIASALILYETEVRTRRECVFDGGLKVQKKEASTVFEKHLLHTGRHAEQRMKLKNQTILAASSLYDLKLNQKALDHLVMLCTLYLTRSKKKFIVPRKVVRFESTKLGDMFCEKLFKNDVLLMNQWLACSLIRLINKSLSVGHLVDNTDPWYNSIIDVLLSPTAPSSRLLPRKRPSGTNLVDRLLEVIDNVVNAIMNIQLDDPWLQFYLQNNRKKDHAAYVKTFIKNNCSLARELESSIENFFAQDPGRRHLPRIMTLQFVTSANTSLAAQLLPKLQTVDKNEYQPYPSTLDAHANALNIRYEVLRNELNSALQIICPDVKDYC